MKEILSLLKSKSEKIQEIACGALMHLSESSICRDEMVGLGAMDSIATLLPSPSAVSFFLSLFISLFFFSPSFRENVRLLAYLLFLRTPGSVLFVKKTMVLV